MPEVLPYGDNRAQKILELRLMEAGENMKFVLGKFFFFSGRSGSRKNEFIKETVTI